jgi:hypothetical protein
MDKAPVYLDNRSVLVSTAKGLKRITVPFLVVVMRAVDKMEVGDKVTVILVSFTKTDPLLYFIRNRYYNYTLFVIDLTR